MGENAIELKHISKVYKLYDKPSDCLKESLGLTRKCKHKDHYALDDINFTITGYAIGTEDVSTNPAEACEQCKLIGNIP